MLNVRDLVMKLVAVPGPSGFEDAVCITIRNELAELGAETSVDGLGNLVLRFPGPPDAPSLMLMAHMDQVGLIVKHIESTGFIYCDRIGLIDERTLLASQVEVWTDNGPRLGVVGVRSRHLVTEEDLRKPIQIDDLWIDVGARSTAEIEKLGIQIGQPVTLRGDPVRLSDDLIVSPSIDNRAGCAALIRVAAAAAKRERDTELIFVWSSQEEVGSRGAKVAAQTLQPTLALVTDTTPAGDPSTPTRYATAQVGAGPVIRALDTRGSQGTIYSGPIKRQLIELAVDAAIPHQLDVFPTWTDASEVHLAGRGVPTGGVYIPRLCSHSANEILDFRDLEYTIDLLEAFTRIEAEQLRKLATRPAYPLLRAGDTLDMPTPQ